ncbi:LuxR C-terminal-related transcriptional regulator [Methylobacterium tarhaniae]|uniref:LuxR C-terminal-related transcriptional regulator n=1 Tax=Methylobacterium tarhaniae TaxID=1187852 RepID=UPI003D06F23D
MTMITCPDMIVVGSDELLREGLALLLQSAEYKVSASLPDLPDIIDCDLLIVCSDQAGAILAEATRPGRMPSRTKLVVLLSGGMDACVSTEVLAGAAALLDRASSPKKFLIAIQAVMTGVIVHDAALLDTRQVGREPLAAQQRNDLPILLGHALPEKRTFRDTVACSLSLREKEILSSLAEGNSNKVIARKHNITEATVKVHVRHILRKLNFNNRTQAALWAKDYSMMVA